MRPSFAIAIAACALVASTPARAENAEALRLFEEGRALADQGKYPEACERFARSYELERAPGTMLNLGDCAEREGKYRRAWLMYDAAAREFDRTQKPGRAKFARDHADALAPKLATIVIRLAAPRIEGLVVRVGDRAAPPGPEIIERLDAGDIPIVVSAPGHEPFSSVAHATGGREVVVEVPALRVVAGPPPPPPPPDRPGRRRPARVGLALGLSGAGVLGLGASLLVGRSARSMYDDQIGEPGVAPCSDSTGVLTCTPDGARAIDAAFRRADLGTALAIGGGVLVAAGIVIYVTAPRERLIVAPIASSSAVGLGLSGAF